MIITAEAEASCVVYRDEASGSIIIEVNISGCRMAGMDEGMIGLLLARLENTFKQIDVLREIQTLIKDKYAVLKDPT